MLHVKYVVLLLHFSTFLYVFQAATYYVTTERPIVQYINPKYISYFNVTALRYGRRNLQYYVMIHLTTLVPADNNVTFDIFFYNEYSYNQYRRTFLEFHFKWCNLFLNDMFFTASLRKILPLKCPHPAGTYHLYNLTLNADAIPESFPFTKGRILVNSSYIGQPVGSVYADMELKKYKKTKF